MKTFIVGMSGSRLCRGCPQARWCKKGYWINSQALWETGYSRQCSSWQFSCVSRGFVPKWVSNRSNSSYLHLNRPLFFLFLAYICTSFFLFLTCFYNMTYWKNEVIFHLPVRPKVAHNLFLFSFSSHHLCTRFIPEHGFSSNDLKRNIC